MKEKVWLLVIVSLSVSFLAYSLSGLSINYYEANIYFDKHSLLHYLVHISCALFGENDFGLRVPFLFLHVVNTFLIYAISKPLLKNPIDRLMNIIIYVMLPGINASALLVNEAGVAIFITLLFVYLWERRFYTYSYILLILSLWVDNSFAILYLSLFFYAIVRKQNVLIVLSLILFSMSMYIYGFESHGKPKGYFLDTIGVYAATLSPLILLYYIYTLYRIAVKEQKHILWFISFGAFMFSLLLSMRQRLYLEDFLPFAIIATPLMVKVFLNSYRVRLEAFRKVHRALLALALTSLGLNFLATIFNQALYPFYEKPTKHFAYKNQMAKELAFWLKSKDINEVHVTNKRLAKRLKFYGIHDGDRFELKKIDLNDKTKSNDIFNLEYFFKPVAKYKIVPKK